MMHIMGAMAGFERELIKDRDPCRHARCPEAGSELGDRGRMPMLIRFVPCAPRRPLAEGHCRLQDHASCASASDFHYLLIVMARATSGRL